MLITFSFFPEIINTWENQTAHLMLILDKEPQVGLVGCRYHTDPSTVGWAYVGCFYNRSQDESEMDVMHSQNPSTSKAK